MDKLGLTYREAAYSLGLSVSTLRRLIREGRISPPVSLGTRIRVFDAQQLRSDWHRITHQDCGASDWDSVL
jgi:excisionase family DNA binding protein